MDIVLTFMVERLKLPKQPRQQPYKVGWIDNTSISVAQCCLVFFVKIIMTLFGVTLFCGKKNTYTLLFINKKALWKPMWTAKMNKYKQKKANIIASNTNSLHILTNKHFQ